MSSGSIIILILLIALALFLIYKIKSMFKFPKTDTLTLIHGGVKTGKTTLACALSVQQHMKKLKRYRRINFFRKLFNKPLLEEPLLYSNIPLTVPYVKLDKSLLTRDNRFVYDSTILISEASLVADSQLGAMKGDEAQILNEQLLLFFKLCGHELHGGNVVLDTQCVQDVHYAVKRSLSSTLYIDKLVKWIPFFLVAYVREERYSEDGSIVNNYDKDVEDSLKKVLIPKKVWKYFDCYCYSAFTDNKPVLNTEVVNNSDDLKVSGKTITSFRKWHKDL